MSVSFGGNSPQPHDHEAFQSNKIQSSPSQGGIEASIVPPTEENQVFADESLQESARLQPPDLSQYSGEYPPPEGAQEACGRIIEGFCSAPQAERAQDYQQNLMINIASVFAQCYHIDDKVDKEQAFVTLVEAWSCPEIQGQSTIDPITIKAFKALYTEVFGEEITEDQANQMLTTTSEKQEKIERLQNNFKQQFLTPLSDEMKGLVEARLQGYEGEGGNSSADVIREFNKLVNICVLKDMSPIESAGYIEGKMMEYLGREGNEGSEDAVKAGIKLIRKSYFKEAFLAGQTPEYRENVDKLLSGKQANYGRASADVIKIVNKMMNFGVQNGWSTETTKENINTELERYMKNPDNQKSQGAVEAAKAHVSSLLDEVEQHTPQTTSTSSEATRATQESTPEILSHDDIQLIGSNILQKFADKKGAGKSWWADNIGIGSNTRKIQDKIKEAVREAAGEGGCTRTELWTKIYGKLNELEAKLDSPLAKDESEVKKIINKEVLPEVKYNCSLYVKDEKKYGRDIAIKLDRFRFGAGNHRNFESPIDKARKILDKQSTPYDLEAVVNGSVGSCKSPEHKTLFRDIFLYDYDPPDKGGVKVIYPKGSSFQ